ncbi:MAG: hypothetical protein J7J52_04700 [Deltaproteobacteria bacterium]|nr:hypothetical protein [Deltaproteobacteria bacterium]
MLKKWLAACAWCFAPRNTERGEGTRGRELFVRKEGKLRGEREKRSGEEASERREVAFASKDACFAV